MSTVFVALKKRMQPVSNEMQVSLVLIQKQLHPASHDHTAYELRGIMNGKSLSVTPDTRW